ncbi:MAG: hypothetical protein AB8B56_14345, partial [Crocinitomicaceae bacterium]
MSKEPNNIDRLVREKLDGFEMTPPPGVWENTAASLNGGRRKRFFLWFVLSFVFLTAFGTSIYFFTAQNDETEQLAVNNAIGQKEKSNQGSSDEESHLNSTNNASSSDNNDSDVNNTSESYSTNDNSMDSSSENSNENTTVDSDGNSTSSGGGGSSQKQHADKSDSNGQRSSDGRNMRATSDKDGSNDQRSSDSENQQASSSEKSGGDQNAKSDRRTPNPLTYKGSKKDGDNLANSRTSNGDTEKKGSGNLSDQRTDSQSSSGNGAQNNVANSSETNSTENDRSLPIRPAQEFVSDEPSIANDKIEAKPLNVSAPFWKAFSLEGAIGMSTFRNITKSDTSSNLLSALNAASSGEQSLDLRFGVNYHFTNRLSLQSGVHFNASKENYSYDGEQLQTFFVLDTISFSIDTSLMDTTWVVDTNIFDSTIMATNTVLNRYRILT